MFKQKIKLRSYSIIFSIINLVLYHFAFYKFIFKNTDVQSFNGIVLILSLTVTAFVLNALVFYIGLFLLRIVGKWLLVLFFNINAIAIYFVNTYGVIIDKSMIGNVINTNYEESRSFFSLTLIIYLIFLGIIPSWFILKFKILNDPFKKFIVQVSLALIFIASLSYANASNWLWIDKYSKQLGALVMPWSYVVNTSRFYIHKNKKNQKEILLPKAIVKDSTKSVVVLVIGESARRANFSLYGYHKKTNPLLSKLNNLYAYPANSSATYTTAGVKSILDHKKSRNLYEILPNYLYRNGIDVIWRTTNWGEPNVTIKNYINKQDLGKIYPNKSSEYDEILLCGLKERIQNSGSNKIFIILHTSTSHGPTYSKKYPKQFNQFLPICESVELSKCTQEELINAYDNTILYTDYILSEMIKDLTQLKDYNSTMLFVSDHGESLGEKNLYMHGLPMRIAPKEQFEIPFIVWTSNDSVILKENKSLSQYHVFHSVLDFLAIESSVYDATMSIFK